MLQKLVKVGSIDVSVTIRILDSVDGSPETGVVAATSGLALYYRRERSATVALTESDMTALTDAHADGAFKHIGDGYYTVDVPDAAFATGAKDVLIAGAVTGMQVIGCLVQLVAVDLHDTVRFGLTALPNAAADGAGGLPISDAGGLDLDAQVGTKITAIDGKTTNLPSDPADQSALEAFIDARTDAIEADTQDIQNRIPAALHASGNMKAQVLGVVDEVFEGDGTTGNEIGPVGI